MTGRATILLLQRTAVAQAIRGKTISDNIDTAGGVTIRPRGRLRDGTTNGEIST